MTNHLAKKMEEPSLDELLADNAVQKVMEVDGVDASALRSTVEAILKRRSSSTTERSL